MEGGRLPIKKVFNVVHSHPFLPHSSLFSLSFTSLFSSPSLISALTITGGEWHTCKSVSVGNMSYGFLVGTLTLREVRRTMLERWRVEGEKRSRLSG
jgi:hypothetical protein